MTFNANLEFIFNPDPTNNRPLNYIDYRINSVGLNEMENEINNIIKNSIASVMHRNINNPNGLLQNIISFILTNPVCNNIQPTEANISDFLIKELENYFHKNTLRDDDFNWISIDNPRIVNFVWASLRACSFSQTKSNISINQELDARVNLNIAPSFNLGLGQPGNLYRNLHLEPSFRS